MIFILFSIYLTDSLENRNRLKYCTCDEAQSQAIGSQQWNPKSFKPTHPESSQTLRLLHHYKNYFSTFALPFQSLYWFRNITDPQKGRIACYS